MSNHVLGALPALALMGLALALPGAASADVLVGCKNKTNGNVRVVADAAMCRVSEIAISWNATGEQGPAGPAGPRARPDRKARQVPRVLRGRRVLRAPRARPVPQARRGRA
jgi:hypothetical protein